MDKRLARCHHNFRHRQRLLHVVLLPRPWRRTRLPHYEKLLHGFPLPFRLIGFWFIDPRHCPIHATGRWSSQETSRILRCWQKQSLWVCHQLHQMLSRLCWKNRLVHQQNCLHSDCSPRQKLLYGCQGWILTCMVQSLKICRRRRYRRNYYVLGQTYDRIGHSCMFLCLNHLLYDCRRSHTRTNCYAYRNFFFYFRSSDW